MSDDKLDRLTRELEDEVNKVLNKYMPLKRSDIISVFVSLTAGLIEALADGNDDLVPVYYTVFVESLEELLNI